MVDRRIKLCLGNLKHIHRHDFQPWLLIHGSIFLLMLDELNRIFDTIKRPTLFQKSGSSV